MPEKRAQQHVIPRVYLNAFCDPAPPAGHPPGQPFAPAVWLVPKSLAEPPRRRAPRKAFVELHAYTLKGDDPRRPEIEVRLSEVESAYAPVLRRVRARAALARDERRTLALFVATLYLRTPGQMRQWQRFVDDVQHIYRQVDRGANGNERYSDEAFAGADEAGKRQVLQAAGAVAGLLERIGWRLLVNDTPEVFATSDTPVVRREVHVDELLAMGVPGPWLDPDPLPNRREVLLYCPLAPDAALVACPLLPRTPELYWPASAALAANLNLLVRENARELLIAFGPDPFGDLTPSILARDAAAQREAADPRPIVTAYTDRTRVRFRAEAIDHGHGASPLEGRLTFRTRDADALRILAEAERIPEVTYGAPAGRGGRRDARRARPRGGAVARGRDDARQRPQHLVTLARPHPRIGRRATSLT